MLSSPLVTPKITDRPVREPASEWAFSTIDALGPVSSQDQIASNASTPGLQVPGAFPDPYPKAVVVQQDIQYVKDAAFNALQTAKGYMPTSVEDVKRFMEHTGDRVGGYFPQSVTAYLPHTTPDNSLPSETQSQDIRSNPLSEGGTQAVYESTKVSLPSEETSQNVHPESSDGAGILPGPPDEFGVSILPDERQNHTPALEALGSETGIEERRQQNLPSLDVIEKSSAGGVGALPGNKEEVGVALLPGERKSVGASTTLLLPSTKAQNGDISSTGPPLPDKDTNASSTHASHPTIPNTSATTNLLANDGFKVNGVPSSEGFQQGLDQEQLSPTEKSIDEQRDLKQGQSDLATAGHEAVAEAAVMGSSSHAEHETVRKKPGFMDKLKGEMKVISGKLSHKESRVEEGRRMMGRN